MSHFKIGIVGAGNVGSHLCRAFSDAGHKITVFTRRGATHLLKDVNSLVWTEHLHTLRRGFDFIVIAISDDHISEVAKELNVEDGILLHTSGSKAMSNLQSTGNGNVGVFYPLQTFQKNLPLNYKEIPVFIESNKKENLQKIRKLAGAFSENIQELNSEQRKRLHLAAVMVNNFSNHMYRLSQDYLKLHKLPFEHLIPLIQETANRLGQSNAADLQTGPARRNDDGVMQEHLDMLKEYPEILEIYSMMSESIKNHYKTS